MTAQTPSLKTIVTRCAIIALVAAGVGFADSRVRDVVMTVRKDDLKPTVLPVAPNQAAADAAAGSTSGQPSQPVAQRVLGYEISIEDGFALHQMGIPFIDSRHLPEYQKSHIEGAVCIPTDDFQKRVGDVMGFLPGPIVVYCSGGQCDASHNLAKLLQQAGFTQIHILTDGLPGWQSAGHPVASGGGGK